MSQTIFITGVTAGIGAATARKFIANGWQVIGTGRRRDRLDTLAAELGEGFHPLMLDMQSIADFGPALSGLPDQFQAIDLLLNNAGLAPPMSNLQDAEQEPIDTVIATNVDGLVALTRHLLPRLIDRKGGVINLSSVAATYPYRGGAVYAGTKAFVRQFSLGLRCDLHGTGVRVTSIEPGMAETEFTLVRTQGDQAASDALYADMNPMTADDIAETIWWVASLPAHVNINSLELMPTSQSWAGFAVHRG
ncbi:SDR family NAD(P)-dependent oxidoreductase [Sphingomonas xanthus]|uniref:SDR family NAD(P)-dependent oxidoreductase n=1 Tax=Sphingomonas xanthus TaxID=2594473 RepID=A0A516IS21_9SPHN|nr:SDR family NAD(P)-dependent oxidoreductase [Sphingomonas xanthus]QDP19624.1 SDR family NAD(P)-dependent oxidoreductase [Sphingomonas xanthus]